MEGGGGGTATGSSRPSGKHSKASLTSVSPCRKVKDKSVPRFVLKQTQLCYRMSDVVVSLLLIFPLVIGFWRGVWNLMEHYSKLYGMGPWLCIGLGYFIPFVLYVAQEPLKKHVRPRRMNYVLFYVISRLLLLLHSFGSVNQWKGLWALCDQQLGLQVYSASGSLVVGVILSMLLKTFCNVLAPPLFVAVDEAYSLHDCPLRFQTPPKQRVSYLLDCLVSVIVASSLVVLCWRGLWELADLYLYPDNAILSAVASLSFGYVVVLMLLIFQPIIHRTMEKFEGFLRLLIADLVTFVGFVGCVFAWRGLWMVYDELLVLGTPNELESNWLTAIIGGLGSMVLGCISTVVVRGVAVDGDVSDNGTSEWPIPYVSLLRDSIYDAPFPEPWIFRYLCTPQKMNCSQLKPKKETRAQEKEKVDSSHGMNQPVNMRGTNLATIVSEARFPTAQMLVTQDSKSHPLRNIDSSSEEDDESILPVPTNPRRRNYITDKNNGERESLQSESYELKPFLPSSASSNIIDIPQQPHDSSSHPHSKSIYKVTSADERQSSSIPSTSQTVQDVSKE